MSDVTFGALDLLLGFGAPLSWAVYELVKTRREIRRDREKAARERSEG